MRTAVLLFFFSMLYSTGATAQDIPPPDTTSESKTPFGDFNYFTGYNEISSFETDSFLARTYFYDRSKNSSVYLPRSGGPGAASFDKFYNGGNGKLISDGFDQFNPYLLSPFRNLPSTVSERRYTGINYHLGSKKEQHILLRHEQKIKPWFLAGIDFGAASTQGDFARQLHTNRGFALWLAYESPSNVYRTYADFTSNRIQNQENGGITVDTVFENASSLNTRTLPINLDNAAIRHKSREFVLHQDLNISNLIRSDSAKASTSSFNANSLVLSQMTWWKRKSILYTDQQPDSGYYSNFYVDSVATYDSTFYNDLYNQLMLKYTLSNGLYAGVGAEHQLVNYFVSYTDTSINSLSAVFTAGYQGKDVSVDVSFAKSVDGDFDESYRASLMMRYQIKQKSDFVFLKISGSKSPQHLRERAYFSNHFLWNRDFDLMETLEGSAGIQMNRYKFSVYANIKSVKNLVYYSSDFLPVVFSDYVTFGDLNITKSFLFGRFGSDSKLTLSYTGNEKVVATPEAAFVTTLYYKNMFFKNALGFRAGVDVQFQSAYYAYGYMPATGIFYIQNEKKTGNYPTAGVFVNLRIKSAELFIRLDHLNAGINDREYYGAYHYPLPGRTFKFGVNWILLD